MLSLVLFANSHPYEKEITFEDIKKSTLVKVKIDKEIYENTEASYASVRLKSSKGEEGYFIEREQSKSVLNQQQLIATSYERDKAKLHYEFREPFEVEELQLNIEDRNFESLVDVYADGVLVSEGNKIYDYSNETGIQNFSIKITKQKIKKLTLVYHIDKTTSFYKKYKDIRKRRQYLSIKSLKAFNHNKIKKLLDKHYFELLSSETKDKVSTYIFKVNNMPSQALAFLVSEKNFKRKTTVYASNDLKTFTYLKDFFMASSSFTGSSNLKIALQNRSQYLKVVLENKDNKPLKIEGINILTQASYLYFIAEPNEGYALYFGDKNLKHPSYELKSIVSKKDIFEVGTFSKVKKLKVSILSNETSWLKKYKETLFGLLILMVLGIMSYVAFVLLKRVEQ